MKKKQPLISIIVPVYKAEKYLKQCLDSLIGQSLAQIEIICVNDGSPDRCRSILDHYAAADDRFKIIHQENTGVGVARAVGLEQVTAPYVAYVDADDWVERETFQLALEAMTGDESLDLLTWNASVFGEPGVKAYEIEKMSKLLCLRHEGSKFLDDELRLSFSGFILTSMFRMDLIKKYEIGFKDFLFSEDHLFLMQYLAVSHKVLFLDRTLYHYRRHPDSITANILVGRLPGQTNYLDVVESVFDFYQRHNLWPGQEGYLMKCLQKYFWLDIYKLAQPITLKNKARVLARKYHIWFKTFAFYKWLVQPFWTACRALPDNFGEFKELSLLELRALWIRLKIRLGRI